MTELERFNQYLREYQKIVQKRKVKKDREEIQELLEYWNDTIHKAEEELDLLQQRKREEAKNLSSFKKDLEELQEEIKQLEENMKQGLVSSEDGSLVSLFDSHVNRLYHLCETIDETEMAYNGYLIDINLLQKQLSFFYFYRDYLYDHKAAVAHHYIRDTYNVDDLNEDFEDVTYSVCVYEYLEKLIAVTAQNFQKMEYGMYFDLEKKQVVLWVHFPSLEDGMYVIHWNSTLEEIESQNLEWDEESKKFIFHDIEQLMIPCRLHDFSSEGLTEYGDNEIVKKALAKAIREKLYKRNKCV